MNERFSHPSILPPVYRRDPDGKLVETVPAGPCPELLTEEEAIRYLRLDLVDVENPDETLRRYRKQGLIRGTQVGKCVRYEPIAPRNPRFLYEWTCAIQRERP